MTNPPVPSQAQTNISVDGNYLMGCLRDLNESIGVLPNMEKHLDLINGAIAKSVITVHALDQRVINIDSRVMALERVVLNMDLLTEAENKSRRIRGAKLFSFGLQLLQGVALLYVAWQFFS